MKISLKNRLKVNFICTLIVIVLLTPTALLADEAVTPGHVYARLQEVKENIKLIRYYMGKPESSIVPIHVSNVAAGEVYFQAQSLLKKSNRLGFEQLRSVADIPPSPVDITTTDVLALVNLVVKQLVDIKQDLHITDKIDSFTVDPSIQVGQVFRAMMECNRQLNLLLDNQFSPADAFEQVTLAITYTARLRALFPGDRIPVLNSKVQGKQPRDVYRILIACFQLLSELAEMSSQPVMNLETTEQKINMSTPSDVYDIASMIVAELASFHRYRADLKEPRTVYHPGRKVPSDVYQRAEILYEQLREIKSFANQHPDWLDAEKYP